MKNYVGVQIWTGDCTKPYEILWTISVKLLHLFLLPFLAVATHESFLALCNPGRLFKGQKKGGLHWHRRANQWCSQFKWTVLGIINSELNPAQSFAKSLLCFWRIYFSSSTFRGLVLGSFQLSACTKSLNIGGKTLLQTGPGGTTGRDYSVSMRLFI